jgi:predicted DNA-binding transcriptional regulator AlpA
VTDVTLTDERAAPAQKSGEHPTQPTQPKRKHYSTARQVRERYGDRSGMWLWRKLKYDPKFPRPMSMGKNLRLFDDDELDRYDASLKGGA